MRIWIKYDAGGRIASVMKMAAGDAQAIEPFSELAEGEAVLEVNESPELAELDCHEIVERFDVDAKQRRLRARATTRPSEPRPPPGHVVKRPKKGSS